MLTTSGHQQIVGQQIGKLADSLSPTQQRMNTYGIFSLCAVLRQLLNVGKLLTDAAGYVVLRQHCFKCINKLTKYGGFLRVYQDQQAGFIQKNRAMRKMQPELLDKLVPLGCIVQVIRCMDTTRKC